MLFSVRVGGFNDIIEMSHVLNAIIMERRSTPQKRIFKLMEFGKYYFKNQFAICTHVANQGEPIIGFQFLVWSDPNWFGIDNRPSN
tara:strand:- start:409 stop:666 length:258 start_codon:yes stop_codon:yes gene_type:complete